jgi:DNA helicase-2/ATP-dependent DNA helicase PcrA
MILRDQQQAIAGYRGGLLAVSAVPGSGKTHTLAALAAGLIRDGRVGDEGEVLVVTFTNSAVDNFQTRIRKALQALGLPPTGYRVLTLHGLANAIVRERPDLAGTVADFRIDDELSGRQAMPEAAREFIAAEREYWLSFLPPGLSQQQQYQAEERWRETTQRVGEEVTRLAKNLRLAPRALRALISGPPAISPFLRIGAAIYERYERILSAGGRLDFDDLIWRAIMALDNDDGFRRRLGRRWPFILEDEAQDSTPLQERILDALSREHGNWVRVGDPNQAIMTTFTASDVRFFRDVFPNRPGVVKAPLARSGRSGQPIIDLANRLAAWAAREHPEPEARRMALTDAVPILPTEPGDPQHNPPAGECHIHVQAFSAEDAEASRVADSAVKYVLSDAQRTCGILTPTNQFGRAVVEALTALQARHPERAVFQDQLRNTLTVRNVARVMAQAARFCSLPTNTYALIGLRDALIDLGAWQPDEALRGAPGADSRIKTLLRSAKPERLLFRSPAEEPALSDRVEVSAAEAREIERLAELAAKWLRASVLPVDQLVLTVAHDVLRRDNDLAIAHSLAVSVRRYAAVNPQAQLIDLADQLADIAENRQKYLSNALIESGFEPEPGVVTVTTMHKAKGLEWDRVYLTGVDQVEFPHDVAGTFRGEQWYLEGRDPATEARMQLQALAAGEEPLPGEDALLRRARLEYISERLRLLYVGISRARRDLIISYSKERRGRPNALALAARAILE